MRRREPAVGFKNYSYGYFSVIAFIIPIFRWLAVRSFRRRLRVNDEIREMKSADPNTIRQQANLAIRSWRVYHNPEASRLLAEALSSINHFTMRLTLPGVVVWGGEPKWSLRCNA
jgi:hypothetical protein